MKRRFTLALLTGLMVGGLAPHMANAQAWPAKAIKFIVPFPPGGPTDALGRQVAAKLAVALGQPVVIENIGGANGAIGMGQVSKAKPDGYTVGLGGLGSQVINPYLYAKLPYASPADFTPISLVAEYINVLVVNSQLPVKNVPELISYAKANPGKISYGSAGSGSSNHLAGSQLAKLTSIEAAHIPYKGSSPALMDLLANNTTFMFDVMVTSMPQVRTGKLRILGTTGAKRDAQLPDVPAIAEFVPGFELVGWFGLLGPAGMPDDVTQRLSAEIARISQSPDIIDALAKQGFEFVASTPAQFKDRIAKDLRKFEPIIKASGAKVE